MKAYLLTLIGVALALSLVSILSPTGERGGIAKHVGLLVSLVLICTLLAPIRGLIENLPALLDPDWIHQEENSSAHDGYREEMEQALNNASTAYFSDMLTQALCAEFSIPDGEARCVIRWERDGDKLSPSHVTVLLSGSAIWKDPHAIEDFVTALVGCVCETAIESSP